MLNLVEKYTAEAAAETEDGVVAIEYVIVAAALVVALAALWTARSTLCLCDNRLQGRRETHCEDDGKHEEYALIHVLPS